MKNVAGLAVTIKGTSPMNVVTEVKIIGLNLTAPALETASSILCPSSLNLLMVITRTRLAFTTTPLNAIIPRIVMPDNSVINVSSQPALKVKINLGLTYDTDENDMQKAIDILEDIVKNQEAITDDYSAGFNGFGDFSLNILFMYYVKPESHWLDTQTLVNKEILKRFNEEKLDFAFPTQTILKKEI